MGDRMDSPDGGQSEHAAAAEAAGPCPAPLKPDHGLGRWIAQGVVIVLGAPLSFMAAVLLELLLSRIPFGIAMAPITAGIYLMALRRFRGQAVRFRTVFEGLRYTPRVLVIIAAVWVVPTVVYYGQTYLRELPAVASLAHADLLPIIGRGFKVVWGLVVGAALFFAIPLVIDREMSAVEAMKASWAVTRRAYWSYLLMTMTLYLVSLVGLVGLVIGVLLTRSVAVGAIVSAYMYYFDDSTEHARSGGA